MLRVSHGKIYFSLCYHYDSTPRQVNIEGSSWIADNVADVDNRSVITVWKQHVYLRLLSSLSNPFIPLLHRIRILKFVHRDFIFRVCL